MTLADAQLQKEYIVQKIDSDDDEMVKFLFSLGCYSGEPLSVITKKKHHLTLSIKDARYNIDMDLAKSILI